MKKELLKRAEELQKNGDLVSAIDIYQQLLTENPNEVDILHRLGILFAQQHKYQDALDYLNQAIQYQPRSAPFHNSKGNILLRQGALKAGEEEYRQAIKSDPRYAIAHNNLGRCFYLQEKLIAARKSYAKAIQLNPRFGDAYYNQGVLLLKLGEYSLAMESLQKALTYTPKNPAIDGQIAQIYLQESNYAEAIKHLQKRLAYQPEHVESLHYLGIAYLATEQNAAAITCFEKILQLTYRHPQCYEHLATAYLKQKDNEKALTYYLRQLEVQATAFSYYNIGVLLIEKGRRQDAIEYLKQVLSLEPNHLPAHLNLGVEYLKLQQLQQARYHYEQATKIKPDDPEIEYILHALTQNQVPDRAPAEYLQNLFNQYASYYDKHLTEHLHYRVPQLLHTAVWNETKIEQPGWNILDLGCGTGLCGELFKEFAEKLIGIDISSEMVSAAKSKNIYDELKIADIEKALSEYQEIDLILAADVFTYIGDLSNIFIHCHYCLKPKGLFAFSVEKSEKTTYELQPSIRYAHSRQYIESIAKISHFNILRFDNIQLRMQKDEPVNGYLVILRKE